MGTFFSILIFGLMMQGLFDKEGDTRWRFIGHEDHAWNSFLFFSNSFSLPTNTLTLIFSHILSVSLLFHSLFLSLSLPTNTLSIFFSPFLSLHFYLSLSSYKPFFSISLYLPLTYRFLTLFTLSNTHSHIQYSYTVSLLLTVFVYYTNTLYIFSQSVSLSTHSHYYANTHTPSPDRQKISFILFKQQWETWGHSFNSEQYYELWMSFWENVIKYLCFNGILSVSL